MRVALFPKAFVAVGLYAILTWLGFQFITDSNGTAAFWPAAGFGFGVVYWAMSAGIPRYFSYLIVPSAYLIVAIPILGFEGTTLVYAIAHTVESVIAAEYLWMEWRKNAPGHPRNQWAFLGVAFIAPAISGVIAAGLREYVSAVPLESQQLLTWWLAHSIGIVAVGPALAGLVEKTYVWQQRTWNVKSFIAPSVALIFSALSLFMMNPGYVFPGVLVTVWWALQFGFGPTSIAIAFFSSAVGIAGASGHSPFPGQWALELTQFFVFAYAAALSATAALADARRLDFRRVTENERRVQRALTHDPVTGLPWRKSVIEQVGTLDQDRKLMVAIVDVDGMSRINDDFGRAIGDQLLEVLAQRFLLVQRKDDLIARLGGDEFLFVASDVSSEAEALKVMKGLLNGLMAPPNTSSVEVSLSVCSGVTLGEAGDFEELLREADYALHEIKQRGRGKVHIRTARERAVLAEQRSLAENLPQACSRGQIHCVFQPILPITHALPLGAEALVRWNHPSHGQLSPALFIPAQERSGQMVLLGETVSALALRQLSMWRSLDGKFPRWLSLNIHAAELHEGGLHQRIHARIAELELPPSMVMLELTEHTTVNMEPGTRHQLEALRADGVRIALDDFGTGYSSLAYLSRLPVDVLKLDGAFLSAHAVEKDRRLIKSICSLAHDIGLHTIVEGVETKDQFDAAVDAGADSVQGYWVGRPMTAEALSDWDFPTSVVVDARQRSAHQVSLS